MNSEYESLAREMGQKFSGIAQAFGITMVVVAMGVEGDYDKAREAMTEPLEMALKDLCESIRDGQKRYEAIMPPVSEKAN